MSNPKVMRKVRLVLDILLCLGTLSLFNKSLFSMHYHEEAGIAVVLLTLIHIGINLRTLNGMRKNFVRVPMNIRLCLITDILLILAFLWEAVCGIMISRTILTGISSSNRLFKVQHFFAGALIVILMGTHIGLHICRKRLPKVLAIVLTVITLALGTLGVAQTSMTRWLTMPFSTSTMPSVQVNRPAEQTTAPEAEQTTAADPEAEKPAEGSAPEGEQTTQTAPEGEQTTAAVTPEGEKPAEGSAPDGQQPSEGSAPEGAQQEMTRHGMGSQSFLQKLWTVIRFAGIMFSFSMITYWIVQLKKSRRKAA